MATCLSVSHQCSIQTFVWESPIGEPSEHSHREYTSLGVVGYDHRRLVPPTGG